MFMKFGFGLAFGDTCLLDHKDCTCTAYFLVCLDIDLSIWGLYACKTHRSDGELVLNT